LLFALYISLSTLRHKKIRTERARRSFAHDRCDGDGEEAYREQNPGCAVGMAG
jgi:hypothetical protein